MPSLSYMQWRMTGRRQWQLLNLDAATARLKYSVHALFPYKAEETIEDFRIIIQHFGMRVFKDPLYRLPVPDHVQKQFRLWSVLLKRLDPVKLSEGECMLCESMASHPGYQLATCCICLCSFHDRCSSMVDLLKGLW